ncbi:transmembrane protein, putative (macronuclear) [Tetrahymena thermophila SB210]|uniref:Transmembrane protein, putative n=1 Tax=Tetrahymena thermophila (strain SB210) TaxID=312017 RepID=Q235F5_TETTS|nr:transmembrane protein, putative [Tetrahymena thermophila SB210]EAR92148.3 transmembrane protein, putative [Tetrahymena thermophila SB210]|eukprot:XP_001012393.3 transmembrane protein, putative [Tetrahymena thermophila SB210]
MKIDITKDFIRDASAHQTNKYQNQMKDDEISVAFNIFTNDIVLNIEKVFQTLKQNEEKYLTSSSFEKDALTEQEKDDLDKIVKESIVTLNGSVSSLNKNLKEQKGFLKSRTTNEYAHKEVVISCLSKRLKDLAQFFSKFQKYRLDQKEKLQKLLNQEQTKQKMFRMRPKREDLEKNSENNKENHGVSELEQDNQFLLSKYHDDEQKRQNILNNIQEIGAMLDNLSKEVEEQKETTQQILQNAEDTLKLSEQANVGLRKAVEYSKDVGKAWSILFFGLGVFLLFYDFIKS